MAIDPNDQTVEEFSLGMITRLISQDDAAIAEARADFDRYAEKFKVVVFLAGMVAGFFPTHCASGCHPLDQMELWQQYLLDWQQKPDDER